MMMKGAAIVISLGIAMIVIGLTRGFWQAMIDGIVNSSHTIRGAPPNRHPIDYSTGQREPLLALLGFAFVLLGVWACLST
jgi:hypothetical protein